MNPRSLKRALLLFWAVWLTVVFGTNLADGLKALGLLKDTWTFASGNYRFIAETTARYGTPPAVNAVLFAGVILWEGLAAGLFWRAGLGYRGREASRSAVYPAFTAALLLWGTFMVADELLMAYAVEATHLRLFVAHLVTLMAIALLPDGDGGHLAP